MPVVKPHRSSARGVQRREMTFAEGTLRAPSDECLAPAPREACTSSSRPHASWSHVGRFVGTQGDRGGSPGGGGKLSSDPNSTVSQPRVLSGVTESPQTCNCEHWTTWLPGPFTALGQNDSALTAPRRPPPGPVHVPDRPERSRHSV